MPTSDLVRPPEAIKCISRRSDNAWSFVRTFYAARGLFVLAGFASLVNLISAESADSGSWTLGSAWEVVDQAFHTRQYGGLSSNDTAVALGLDAAGNVYISGNTVARSGNGAAWGSTEPGDYCAGSDIFLCGLTRNGDISWVRRFGTPHDDFLRAMVVADDAIYVCGATYGAVVGANQGDLDAFISKFTLSGSEIWSYQLGSNDTDECSAIVVGQIDDNSGSRPVYIAGSTAGDLFGSTTFERVQYRYVARFSETPLDGLKLVEGTQKSTIQTTSTAGIALSSKYLYVATNTYDADKELDAQAGCTIELFHFDMIKTLRQTPTMVRIGANQGFYATKLVVDLVSGDAYVAGVSYSLKPEKSKYYLGKYEMPANKSSDQLVLSWTKELGPARASLITVLEHQQVSLAQDVNRDMVHVTGMVDGYYEDISDTARGFLSVPLYSVWSNGTTARVVRRFTPYPHGAEQITDIAVDPWSAVLYTGMMKSSACTSTLCDHNRDTESAERVIFGSFGSPQYSSTLPSSGSAVLPKDLSSTPIPQDVSKRTGNYGSASAQKILVSLVVLLGACAMGATLLAGVLFFSHRQRVASRSFDVDTVPECEQFAIRDQGQHNVPSYSGIDPRNQGNIAIGGSARPE
jgi:hypothetical protein